MNRRFRITVDGNAYDVVVEEVGLDQRARADIPKATSRPEPQPLAASAATTTARPRTPSPTPPIAPKESPAGPATGQGLLVAPIPGVISEVRVTQGQSVKMRDVLLVLEAMKMQNEIQAPHDGTVEQVFVSQGANVSTGDSLVQIVR